ncbi:MAG TPA: AtpZ/AtpI family protein [Terracidiphilus sp.]|jgi:F0F1-type ATP synthase assembly protein I
MPYHRPIPEPKQNGKEPGLFSAWIEAEKLMQIALVLPCAVFIGWLIGAWLDRHFHQSWIAIVGIVFGGASGLIYAIRVAMAANKDPKMQDEDSNGSGKDSGGSAP